MRDPIFEEDYTTPVLNALKKHDSGRGWVKGIDCCLSGKDADLDHGAFGIEILSADDDRVELVAHGYLTVAGNDVTLKDDFDDDDEHERAIEKYLEEAESIVMGAALEGEWTGDDWVLTFYSAFTVDLDPDAQYDTDADFDKLAEKIVEKSWKIASNGLDEMTMVSEQTNTAAGWGT